VHHCRHCDPTLQFARDPEPTISFTDHNILDHRLLVHNPGALLLIHEQHDRSLRHHAGYLPDSGQNDYCHLSFHHNLLNPNLNYFHTLQNC